MYIFRVATWQRLLYMMFIAGNYNGDREDRGERGERGRGRGRGRGGSHGGGRIGGEDSPTEGDGEVKKPEPVTYIPPDPTDNEEEMFGSSISSGINFDKFDHITVKVC